MCERCRAEYEDPADRRFHAAAERLPGLRAAAAPGRRATATPRSRPRWTRCRSGAIVAVKGLGGYHLACRADLEPAVAALRARKRREDRPFALMAPSLEAARELVELSPADERLLQGRERPIVIARRRPGAAVAESVAPASADLGVMLPVLAAPPPAARRPRRHARDDERQRVRRADRLRGRARRASGSTGSRTCS